MIFHFIRNGGAPQRAAGIRHRSCMRHLGLAMLIDRRVLNKVDRICILHRWSTQGETAAAQWSERIAVV